MNMEQSLQSAPLILQLHTHRSDTMTLLTPINISQEGIIKLNWIWTCCASIRYDRLIQQEFSNTAASTQCLSEPYQYMPHITETLLVVGVTPGVTAIIRTTRLQLQSQLQSVSVSFSNVQWLDKLFVSFPDLWQRCTNSHSRVYCTVYDKDAMVLIWNRK